MKSLLPNSRRHDITFHRSGKISLTARIVRLLSLSPGDSINIAVSNGEYLLYAIRGNIGRHEAQCYPSKKGEMNYCANSVRLCRSILSLVADQSVPRLSFMVGEQVVINDTLYLPIITLNPLSTSQKIKGL